MVLQSAYSPTRVSISGYDYEFSFKIAAETDLLVYTIDTSGAEEVATVLTYGTDYTVDIDAVDDGGSIETGSYVEAVWTPAEPSGDEILILRNTPIQQTANIPVRGAFRESVIEGGLDNLAKQIQELNYKYELINDADSTAVLNSVVAAQAAQAAAETAQAAAEAAETGAAAAAQDAIDDEMDASTGHRHDGADSRKVLVTSLDVTGLSANQYVKVNSRGDSLEGVGSGVEVITSGADDWTVPAGITKVYVSLVAGGAGGAGATQNVNGGGGGGGGAYITDAPYTVTPGGTVAYSVGEGGAGGTYNTNGVDGNDTTFGDITCGGGKKGLTTSGGGAGGTATGDGSNGSAGTGGSGGGYKTTTGGTGGDGVTATSAGGGGGGGSAFGEGGNGGDATTDGTAAAANTGAGGGGGGMTNGGVTKVGAAGGSGLLVIKY